MDIEEIYHRLLRTAAVLAAPARVQIGVFPAWVCVPDEILLAFEDVRLLAEETGACSPKIARLLSEIRRLDDLAVQMTSMDDQELWTNDALSVRPEWAEMRRRGESLLALAQERPVPKLDWLHFVRGPKPPGG